MAATLSEQVAKIRTVGSRWRLPLTLGAAAVFIIGLGMSARYLDLNWSQVSIAPILLILLCLGPLGLVLAAISLQLSARAVGRRIGFRDALAASAIGRISEILPVPGGAMVRGAALVRSGAGLGESTWIVTLTAFLTLSMATALGSVPFMATGSPVGYIVLIAGGGGTLVSILWIVRRAGAAVAAAMVVLRLGNLVLGVARVSAAFAAIGLALGPVDAALFVICATLGTSVAIVPAGLGVAEVIAAALALLVQVPPAGAFLAVALNRVVGLVMSGVVAVIIATMFNHPKAKQR